MKININRNIIRKGLLFAGLTLTFASTPGCNKTSSVSMNEDTKETLKIYNECLESTELNEDNLEVLSNYNVPMMVIKGENGNYSQVGDDYYVATTDSEIKLLYSKMPGEAEYDMFTGEKLEENIEFEEYITVADFIAQNDITYEGYRLPTHVAYTDTDINTITKIYGEEVAECIKENGIPLKVYEAEDFYEAYKNKKQIKK